MLCLILRGCENHVLLNFTAKFKIPAVESGECCQTIRRNRYRQSKEYGRVLHNPKLGDRVQLYAGLRTKACETTARS